MKKKTADRNLIILTFKGEVPSQKKLDAWAKEFPFGKVMTVEAHAEDPAEHALWTGFSDQLVGGEGLEDSFSLALSVARKIHDPELLRELNEIAKRLGTKNPLKKEFKALQESLPTTEENPEKIWEVLTRRHTAAEIKELFKKLQKAETLTRDKKVLLEEVQAFLVDLPEGDQYQPLRLGQQMVRSHLDLESLLENPHLVEGALYSAFSEYKKQYTRQYLDEYFLYQRQLKEVYALRDQLEERMQACKALDQVPELGPSVCAQEAAPFKAFFEKHPEHPFTKTMVRKHLNKEPVHQGFRLGDGEGVHEEFAVLRKQVDTLLWRKLSKIRDHTISRVVDAEGSDAQKLLNLLNLSNLEEIVELLNTDRSGKIVSSIRKLIQ